MNSIRSEEDTSLQALASRSGCTSAQVKMAMEVVGHDESNIQSYLLRRGWSTKEEKALATTEGEPTPAMAAGEGLKPDQRGQQSNHFAETADKFQQFLRAKLGANRILQRAYQSSQNTGHDDATMLRSMVIALVEENEILARQAKRSTR